jgi:acyl-CoA reductase-like NAD-dependent aldehyde dehydrogenase
LNDARAEVRGSAAWLRHFAVFDDPSEVLQDDERATVTLHRRPIGPTAVIVPWNFPLIMAVQALAPALAAGNTVVLKPSPYTPLTTLRLGQLLAPIVPTGVINVVSGTNELGEWMTRHPGVRKIHFTGSIDTGKRVAGAAATDLKRVTLELGGNDPAIVLDDADVDAIADRLFWSAFRNNGQVCIAIKRVYVPTRMHDVLVSALADRARNVRVGNGLDPETQLGPVNNGPQLERVAGLVTDALSRGGAAASGGHRINGPGLFYEPTILTGLTAGAPIVDEEQFGPVLPVVAYDRLDDALKQANGTHFGLGASVWTSDPSRGIDVAAELECGTAWINTHMSTSPAIPLGGTKWSGIGVAWGRDGYRTFTENHVVHHARMN